ncbi:MAG: shikimate kinase [Vicingaceae bacterium]|mgnify:CR=1 FL=1|jgi:shikimate kinase
MNYPIFLIGFMASGKTSKGKKIARKMEIPFIDLDRVIEEQEKQTITDIFETKGESYFRKLEAKILRQFPKDLKAVIAVGGGAPCFYDNIQYMNYLGTSVFLKRSKQRILGRLRQNKDKRPLVAKLNDQELKDFIEQGLANRNSFYEQAEFIFDADEQKINKLIAVLTN